MLHTLLLQHSRDFGDVVRVRHQDGKTSLKEDCGMRLGVATPSLQ
jgi:hypothetical protein